MCKDLPCGLLLGQLAQEGVIEFLVHSYLNHPSKEALKNFNVTNSRNTYWSHYTV